MTQTHRAPNAAPSNGSPPDYRLVGRHAAFPEISHDEAARLNFLAQMNRHLGTRVGPRVKPIWEARVGPRAERTLGRPPRNRHEVREALLGDSYFQTWSALRRMTMEQRQQAGRWTTLRQAESLAERVAAITLGHEHRLTLDPALAIPDYVSAADNHCMPGSYYSESFVGDVANAANYDHAIFATTGGQLGRFSDGGGRALAQWMRTNRPDFSPKAILEIGSTVGHNLLPIAEAYPDAAVVAVDVGAPVLRYGLARAVALGVDNVRFVQADGTDLHLFPDASFDWIQTTMFLHELSSSSIRSVMSETYRLLRPGGIVLHIEQPPYTDEMPLFEQAMRDWDAFYNNEPFWTTLHSLDWVQLMVEAGFDSASIFQTGVSGVPDSDLFPDAADEDVEDYGRKAAWNVLGATR